MNVSIVWSETTGRTEIEVEKPDGVRHVTLDLSDVSAAGATYGVVEAAGIVAYLLGVDLEGSNDG